MSNNITFKEGKGGKSTEPLDKFNRTTSGKEGKVLSASKL